MRRRGSSLVTALALLLAFWLIWDRLRIVVFVRLEWWGLLIVGVILFLIIDYILAALFKRSS